MTAYLTPHQVAKRWECSRQHVTRLCQRGELRAMKLGTRGWRIKPEAVEAYEQRQTVAVTSHGATVARPATDRRERPPAVAMDGPYALIVKGPVPWRSEVIQ